MEEDGSYVGEEVGRLIISSRRGWVVVVSMKADLRSDLRLCLYAYPKGVLMDPSDWLGNGV
jgi:hypothetical protein